MKIKKGNKFYSIKLPDGQNYLVPLDEDLSKLLDHHNNQIEQLKIMINSRRILIDACIELKIFKEAEK